MARSNFNEIIKGDQPTLVDFYATWCGPCKQMHPILEQLSKEVKGKARILKVDVDKNQKLAMKLSVRSVPTFVIYRKGKIVWRSSGAVTKDVLKKKLESHFQQN